MKATEAQEIVDAIEEHLTKLAADRSVQPDEIVCDGQTYSPASRALPGMQDAWEEGDEIWEYVDGKVDEIIDDLGFHWDHGLLRKGMHVDASS